MPEILIADIKVDARERQRIDVAGEGTGSLENLAKSIQEYGLLEPILLDNQNNLVAGFRLMDPGRLGTATTTECQIRSLTSVPTQCILESTSFPTGTNTITGYSWVVSYTYPSDKTLSQTGTNPRFSFTEMCGQTGSNDSGLQVELKVSLTVTDSEGNSVTVRSNAGSQQLLSLRAYVCGI